MTAELNSHNEYQLNFQVRCETTFGNNYVILEFRRIQST